MSKYTPYPKYKDSGVEWLGLVPEEWVVKRLGHLAKKINSGVTPSGGSNVYSADGILFLRSQNVYDEGLRLDEVVFISEEINSQMHNSKVHSNDILLNITGASLGRTCLVPQNFPSANVNQHVCIIRFADLKQSVFLSWVMKSALIKAQAQIAQTGAARDGLNFSQIAKFIFSLPSVQEQDSIATLLDQETSHIDTIIDKQEQLINLLEEKRITLISHAVSKGLTPDCEMKDSGMKLFGKIPSHWIATKFSHVTESIQTGPFGSQLHADEYVTCGIPIINPAHIANGRLIPEETCTVSEETRARLSRHMLAPGEIIFARRGEMGRCAVVPPHANGWLCGTGCLLLTLSTVKILSEFAFLWLNTSFIREYLELESVGATLANLNTEILRNTPCILPPNRRTKANC